MANKKKLSSKEEADYKEKRKEYNKKYYQEKKQKEIDKINKMSVNELEIYNEQLEKNRAILNNKKQQNKDQTIEQRNKRNSRQNKDRTNWTTEQLINRQEYNSQHYNNRKNNQINKVLDIDELIQEFNESINQPLDKVCIMCRRIYYEEQVNLKYTITQRHLQLIETMYNKSTILPNEKVICCFTCIEYLKRNKLPNIYFENQLYPGDIPEQLEVLTDIELSLISK